MKRITHLVFLLAGLAIPPLASAADAPMIREVYACNFNDGKDMGDLMAARDFYLKQMEKGGQEAATAFVWTPYKSAMNVDLLWANNHANMMEFARRADAYNESAEGRASMERFDSVVTCQSNLVMRRQTYQAEGELNPGANGAVINLFACNYRRGHGPEDLEDLVNHVSDVAGSIALADGAVGYVSVPGVGSGQNVADVIFYGVNGSVENWAARSAAFQAAAGAPSLMRHLQTILECSGSLFYGQRVVPPLE